MSWMRRMPLKQLRNIKVKGEGPPGGFFGPGTHEPGGYLFNETPPPPGQARKWESWEGPWYATMVGSVLILTVGLSAKPNTSLEAWAKEEAQADAAK